MTPIDKQLELIYRGTGEVLPEAELINKLKKNCPLRIKAGFDPTAPDLHLGHTVLINKLKHFQYLGHQVIFLIGDFTGLVGDPTGKNMTRPPLSAEQLQANSKTYQQQIFKILDSKKTLVEYNSHWYSKKSAADMLKLASRETVARMLERDDFKQRYQNQQPIAIHEFLYPIMQGWDSVELKADIELGGTDQKFNLLMGRELQKQIGQEPQIIMTLPLLEGIDGVNKMSKSLDNYIGVDDPANEIFAKTMSISDTLMWRYYELLSFLSTQEINKIKQSVSEGENPRNAKVLLAKELVSRFYNAEAANQADKAFTNQFSKQLIPEDIPTVEIEGAHPLPNLLKLAQLCQSTSEARQMIQQRAVKCDGEKLTSTAPIKVGTNAVFQVGKRRFARIVVR